ncbi:hypothetical protein L204_104774 [Cryptococcus depauperatus]|nr:hypothetical protein L204_05272 [Cryptococcus depauperatus CBS 7855]
MLETGDLNNSNDQSTAGVSGGDHSDKTDVTIVFDLHENARPLFVPKNEKPDWAVIPPSAHFAMSQTPSRDPATTNACSGFFKLFTDNFTQVCPSQPMTKLSDYKPTPLTLSNFKALDAKYLAECIECGKKAAEVALEKLDNIPKFQDRITFKVIDASGIPDVYDDFPEIPVIRNQDSQIKQQQSANTLSALSELDPNTRIIMATALFDDEAGVYTIRPDGNNRLAACVPCFQLAQGIFPGYSFADPGFDMVHSKSDVAIKEYVKKCFGEAYSRLRSSNTPSRPNGRNFSEDDLYRYGNETRQHVFDELQTAAKEVNEYLQDHTGSNMKCVVVDPDTLASAFLK